MDHLFGTDPMGPTSPENYSIGHTRTAQDEDHYGLEDVKDRMLEFLVAGKSRGTEDLHQEIYRDSKGAE
jgi:ATP-dependent Lon protease